MVRNGLDVTEGTVIGETATRFTLHNGNGKQQGTAVYARSKASALRELHKQMPNLFAGVGEVRDEYAERYGPYTLRIHQ